MRLPDIQIELRQIQVWMKYVLDQPDLPPKVRKWTKHVVDRMGTLIAEIDRRPLIKKGRPVSRRITPALQKQAREMYLSGDLTQHKIAEKLGINAGRVSEAVRGKRT